MENLENILVLKTNISMKKQAEQLEPLLSYHPKIAQWSLDLEDIDCVLRIVSASITYNEVTDLVGQLGYFCCELE
jgi:hypothetical protein